MEEDGGESSTRTDLNYHTSTHIIVSSGAIMVLILLSLFGNILVCVAVYTSRMLQTHINYFIVSLAVSDILIATISMPIWMTFEITKFQTAPIKSHILIVQKVWHFVDILGAVASIMNLASISLERYLSVKSPLSHRRCMTNSWVTWGLLVIWLYALVAASSFTLLWNWYWLTAYISILGFFVPLLFIVVAYISVLHVIARSNRLVVTNEEHKRVSITVCVVIGAFVMCWLPFFTVSLASSYNYTCYKYVLANQWLRSVVKWMHYLNSCINPFIYGIFNAQYRDAFKRLMRKLCLRTMNKPLNPPVNPFRDRQEYHLSTASLFLPNVDTRSVEREDDMTEMACIRPMDRGNKHENSEHFVYNETCSGKEKGCAKEKIGLMRKDSEPRYHPHPAFLRVDLGPNRSTAIIS